MARGRSLSGDESPVMQFPLHAVGCSLGSFGRSRITLRRTSRTRAAIDNILGEFLSNR